MRASKEDLIERKAIEDVNSGKEEKMAKETQKRLKLAAKTIGRYTYLLGTLAFILLTASKCMEVRPNIKAPKIGRSESFGRVFAGEYYGDVL
jgi:hypothetical protein